MKRTAGAQMLISPALKIAEDNQSVGPMKFELKLTKDGLHICWWSPRHVLFYKKREEQQLPIFSNVTRATKMPFSNYSSISSSFQLFIPPETKSSGTVRIADLCITAQRLLAATKTYWK